MRVPKGAGRWTITTSVVERYDELEVLRFQFLYVGLPRLDALEYLEGGNDLGVALAALMMKSLEELGLGN